MFELIDAREYEEIRKYEEEFEQWVQEQEEAEFIEQCQRLNAELREAAEDYSEPYYDELERDWDEQYEPEVDYI